MTDTERRVFTNKQGHRSGVVRGKRGESEEDTKDRLGKKGWNMDVPYDRTENDDGTSTFKATDPKVKKRKPKAKPDDKEDKPEDTPESETATDESEETDK